MPRSRDRRGSYREASPPGEQRCPRCRDETFLRPDEIGETPVARCSRCDGVWVSRETFRRVREDIERQSEIATLLGPGEPFTEASVVYLRCPKCDGPMARTNFGRRSGVIVDSCPSHGLWFDCGELAAALEFTIRTAAEPALPERAPVATARASRPDRPVPHDAPDDSLRLLPSALEVIAELLHWW